MWPIGMKGWDILCLAFPSGVWDLEPSVTVVRGRITHTGCGQRNTGWGPAPSVELERTLIGNSHQGLRLNLEKYPKQGGKIWTSRRIRTAMEWNTLYIKTLEFIVIPKQNKNQWVFLDIGARGLIFLKIGIKGKNQILTLSFLHTLYLSVAK